MMPRKRTPHPMWRSIRDGVRVCFGAGSELSVVKHLGLQLFSVNSFIKLQRVYCLPHNTGLDARTDMMHRSPSKYAFEKCNPLLVADVTCTPSSPLNFRSNQTCRRLSGCLPTYLDLSDWASMSNCRSFTNLDRNLGSRSGFCSHSCT